MTMLKRPFINENSKLKYLTSNFLLFSVCISTSSVSSYHFLKSSRFINVFSVSIATPSICFVYCKL